MCPHASPKVAEIGTHVLGFQGHVPAWIRAKCWPSDPSLVFYHPIKFCSNPRYVQRLATILVYGFRRYVGARAASNLNEI